MLQKLLEEIALSLDGLQIPYMIIGGQAVLIHGEPRLTRGIDVALGTGNQRLPDILRFIADRNWTVLPGNPTGFVEKTMVLPCLDTASGIRLDFVFFSSPYERQAMERVTRVKFGNAAVAFASAEDIVIHKIIAGRPRDLEDVRGIVYRKSNINPDYIRDWLRAFERNLEVQEFGGRFEEIWMAAGNR